ncbi:hypothetical protein QQ045_030603 [Rhodiola kirilowii]
MGASRSFQSGKEKERRRMVSSDLESSEELEESCVRKGADKESRSSSRRDRFDQDEFRKDLMRILGRRKIVELIGKVVKTKEICLLVQVMLCGWIQKRQLVKDEESLFIKGEAHSRTGKAFLNLHKSMSTKSSHMQDSGIDDSDTSSKSKEGIWILVKQ